MSAQSELDSLVTILSIGIVVFLPILIFIVFKNYMFKRRLKKQIKEYK